MGFWGQSFAQELSAPEQSERFFGMACTATVAPQLIPKVILTLELEEMQKHEEWRESCTTDFSLDNSVTHKV